jgi:hypothetical protein
MDDNDQNDDVPEIFKGFVTESYKDGALTKTVGEPQEKTTAHDFPQFLNSEDDDVDDNDADEGEDDDAGDENDADDDDGDDNDDDSQSDDEEDDADDEREGKKPRKPKKSASRRIAELTAARRQAEEERDAALAKLAGKSDDGEDDTKPKKDAKDDGPDLTDLSKPDATKYDFGEIDDKYLADLAEYNAEVAARKVEHRRSKEAAAAKAENDEKAAVEKLEQNFLDNVVEPGQKLFDDFDKVVIEGGKAGKYRLTPTLVSLISESEHGAKIMYHFATHPDEAAKVAKMSVERQAAYFGRMEARQNPSDDEDAGKSRRAKPSKAPKPATRRPRGSGTGTRTNPATTDFSAFERMVNNKG